MNDRFGDFAAATPELRELVSAQCDGTLTAEQASRLSELLAGREQDRVYYLAHMQVQGQLWWLHREGGYGESVAGSALRIAPAAASLGKPRGWRRWLALAAVIALAAGLLYLNWDALTAPAPLVSPQAAAPANPPSPEQPVPPATLATPIATIVRLQPPSPDSDIAPGTRLRRGYPLTLPAAVAEICFDNGVRMIVQGPAELTIESDLHVQMSKGAARVEVPRNAIGFHISTPTAKLVDQGTEFGVAVDKNGATQLTVFDGLVECFAVDARGAATSRSIVATGQSLEVTQGATKAGMPGSDRVRELETLGKVEGVRAYWRFEEQVNVPGSSVGSIIGVISDASGNRRRLDYWPGDMAGIGAYVASTDVPPVSMFRAGFSGGYRSFDSGALNPDNSGVLWSNAMSGEADAVRDGFTIEGFYKTAGNQKDAGAMTMLYQGESYMTYILGLNKEDSPGEFLFAICGSYNQTVHYPNIRLSTKNFADGQWHYYVARFHPPRDGKPGAIQLSVVDEEGRHYGGATDIHPQFVLAVSRRPLLVGRLKFYLNDKPKQHFRGLIDEIRISSRVLSDDELLGRVPKSQ